MNHLIVAVKKIKKMIFFDILIVLYFTRSKCSMA